MHKLYKTIDDKNEFCYYIEADGTLPKFLSYFLGNYTNVSSLSSSDKIFEVGPKLNYSTAWGTNALNIFNKIGNNNIAKIEHSIRSLKPFEYDSMTMDEYYSQPNSFNNENSSNNDQVSITIETKNIFEYSQQENLGFDEEDVKYYEHLFYNILKRDPTNVELYDLAQSNSEHSRHWIFNGNMILEKLDGNKEIVKKSLFQTVKNTLDKTNSIIAFSDNSSAIKGFNVSTLLVNDLVENVYNIHSLVSHLTLTAETHNFPTGIAPFEGAATGIGGRIRDNVAIGKGGSLIASVAGYCVGEIFPSNKEKENYDLHTPKYILTEASNGASDYGNKIGEPIILGFTRSFGLDVFDERVEYIKPIMFTAGIGQMYDINKTKSLPESNNVIMRIGGPAYRIGVNGSSASSKNQSSDSYEIDYSAVQRSDPEMENKMNRVLHKCISLLKNNPIKTIHDQGAGGMGNVTKEIISPLGGFVDLNRVSSGDDSLNAVELWVGEYQEQVTILVNDSDVDLLKSIGKKENVSVVDVGIVTDDENIIVEHNSQPVLNLPLKFVLDNIPQKTYHIKEESYVDAVDHKLEGDLLNHISKVFSLVSVGSKRFLTNKVDRSVTGLIAQQQCIGPFHTPLSNYAITALSHFDISGSVVAVGEKPMLSLLNPEKMARMVVGELVTNIMFASISSLSDIKCSGNWMWPAKTNNEKYHLYTAVQSLSKILIEFGISIDGGKDSLSMTTRTQNGKVINSPRTLVLTGYVGSDDIRKKVTPDFKEVGNSIIFIDLANRKSRLGGSSLLHSMGLLNGACPDIENVNTIKETFGYVQNWIREGIILSAHDKSDGGILTTLLEMSISSGYGFDISLLNDTDILNYFFNEELGIIIEIQNEHIETITSVLPHNSYILGTVEHFSCKIVYNNKVVLNNSVEQFSTMWEQTSFEMELAQMDQDCAHEEYKSIINRTRTEYVYNGPNISPLQNTEYKPKVCVIREEGSNGDKEMVSALYQAGFQVHELLTSDIIEYKNSNTNPLTEFNGIVFVGGFSYSDVFGAAKGWAGVILHNDYIRNWFDEFYQDETKFSFGVCNGCQLMALLGWVPNTKIVQNNSKRFESRFSRVKISPSNSIMLQGLEDSILGIWVAHGEGKIISTNSNPCMPIAYVDDNNNPTAQYPHNPNGSENGSAAICSENGRHLAIMPHPERCFKMWQWPYAKFSTKFNTNCTEEYSPWFLMFVNLYNWSQNNKVTK